MARGTQEGRGAGGRWFRVADEPRDWEDFYRNRWSYDRTIRTSHSVNCSGSCSWEVFVKDGLITWELQKTDWPQIRSDTPNYEPRGCQRGISTSWYPYSPVRPKYPYCRNVLLEFWRKERESKDPVSAWAAIVEDPGRKARYRNARGKAGWRRVSWDEVTEIIASAQIYTCKKYGPDHMFSFSPIPAMAMISFTGGQRLSTLIGSSMNSFYEWYHDLPHIMPWIWGDQTDVAESADWYQSTYWIVMGSNLPMTRTADAHFMSENKYNGMKLVNLSPDYSDVTKFADLWVPVRPGTDAAFLCSCHHVILQEYYINRRVPYFENYLKQYTDMPMVNLLEQNDDGNYLQGRWLRASDISEYEDEEHAEWKMLMFDSDSGDLRIPPGSVGHRWEKGGKGGRWNNKLEDSITGEPFDPVLSLMDTGRYEEVPVLFADFTHTYEVDLGKTPGKGRNPTAAARGVPVRQVTLKDGSKGYITTGFDLLCAHYGVARGLSGDYPSGYDDEQRPFTPAWQEQETHCDRELAIRVAREWADNSEATRGKSMFITGSGVLHWFHGGSLTYRSEAVMGILCGCMGVNGGGFNHYVGTEKIRNYAAIGTLSSAADWYGPPRHMNNTSYQYFHTCQYRYDGMELHTLYTPWAKTHPSKGLHAADQNALSIRNGWLPFYPQFNNRNPLEVAKEARADGCKTNEEVANWVARKFKAGELEFAYKDIEHEANHPKVGWVFRGNLIGTSMRGHELALKHLLGTHNNVLSGEQRSKNLIKEIRWRDEAPLGKLDLLANANIRMDSTANYSDIVMPAAHWYERYDMTVTDLHSFIHPFTPAHDPAWEARHDWDIFKGIAAKFSELAKTHFPEPVEDVVMTPMLTDTPDELAQPLGETRDWEAGDVEPIPNKTFPKVVVIERDYTKIYERYVTLGPKIYQNYGTKGFRISEDYSHPSLQLHDLYEELKESWLVGEKFGRPSMEDAKQVAEVVLRISPETDGELSWRFFKNEEERCGLPLAHLVEGERDFRPEYPDLIAQPRRTITSPHWNAIEPHGRTYCPWTLNVETLKPWHTLTGRQQLMFDHRAYRELGESLPTYKPPVDMVQIGDVDPSTAEPNSKVLRFLTPHGKWQIHSMFWDSWQMLNLFRGGQVVWMNDDDAQEIGVEDNDWVECYSENGIMACRAVVSGTVQPNSCIIYHQSERHVNVPFSPLARKRGASDLRGGNNNATTRIMLNPATMVGGYANWTYFINYQGTSPSERDAAVLIRKMPLEAGRKKVIYQEKDLKQIIEKEKAAKA